jgi:hypothetical protein
MKSLTSLLAPNVLGLLAGAGIAAVDNFAFHGEVSPLLIVAMLVTVACTLGTIWGGRAAIPVVLVWAWLPAAHLVKKALNLPDTLHPNTYASILKLAAFTFVVAAVGFGMGLLLNRFLAEKVKQSG